MRHEVEARAKTTIRIRVKHHGVGEHAQEFFLELRVIDNAFRRDEVLGDREVYVVCFARVGVGRVFEKGLLGFERSALAAFYGCFDGLQILRAEDDGVVAWRVTVFDWGCEERGVAMGGDCGECGGGDSREGARVEDLAFVVWDE